MRKIRNLLWVGFLILPFFVFACGDGDGGGTAPPVEPPEETPPSVSLSWPNDQQLVGGMMTAESQVFDDKGIGKVELLIDDVVIAIDTSGKQGVYHIDFNVDALATGTHTLKAQATDNSGNINFSTVEVKVDPVELRAQALQFLRDFNARRNSDGTISGELTRWESMPLIVEVSPEILQDGYLEEVKKATDFWTKYTDIPFEVRAGDVNQVNPMTGKDGVIYIQYGGLGIDPGSNGTEWNKMGEGYTIQASIIALRKVPLYLSLLAHELGHALPLGHTGQASTIMTSNFLRMDPVVAQAMKILYFELVPGSQVPSS